MFFNNGNGSPTGPYSTIEMIDPIELDSGRYELNKNQVYFPLGSEKVYEAEFSWTFYSTYLSNAQQLGNGNVFINEGENSRFFEVNPDDNSIVWEYESPIIGQTFRAYKYDADFSGFDGQDINGTQPLEQNPGPSICLDTYLYVSIDAHNYLYSDSYTEDEFGYVTVYVTGSDPGFEVKIYDESSDIITSQSIMNNESVFISTLMAGTYLLIVKDENGGVFEQSFSIKIPENFEITYEIPITPTYCDEFVKPRLRIQGGTSPYNFKIFDPQGELIRSGSLSSEFWIGNVFIGVEREYTFEIIDKNECYEVITLFIENELETEVFRIEPEIKSPSGPTANDGSIVAHVTGGVKPYVYEWLNGNGEVIQDSIFQNLTPGSYLFRSTDANGCESSELIELNFVSSLNSLDSEIKIELSPNPCSDFLNIYTDINHYSQVINVTILNTNGQEMYTSQMYQAKSQIDVTDLTPGIYMAQFTMAGRSAIQKFVKL